MLKKLGTIDIFIVEANPIVFKGRPWLMQYIRYTNEKSATAATRWARPISVFWT